MGLETRSAQVVRCHFVDDEPTRRESSFAVLAARFTVQELDTHNCPSRSCNSQQHGLPHRAMRATRARRSKADVAAREVSQADV